MVLKEGVSLGTYVGLLLKEGVSLGTDDGLLLKKGVSLGTDDGYWSTMDLYAIMFQEILFFFLEAKCITMSCPSPSDLMHQVKIQPGSAALFIIIISKTLNRTLKELILCYNILDTVSS
jgi:hypothetical protein